MDTSRIRPRQDNLLCRFDWLSQPESVSAGGIIMPNIDKPDDSVPVEATIVAAGPGHYNDTWINHEKGENVASDGFFIPVDPDLKPGARVLVNSQFAGNRAQDDNHEELRVIKEDNCIAILGGPLPRPLCDRVLVRHKADNDTSAGGIYIPEVAREKPIEGVVVAVGPGKRCRDGSLRAPDFKEGDVVLFGKYAGNELRVQGMDHVMLREEDVIGVME